jgi:hypothetical protein
MASTTSNTQSPQTTQSNSTWPTIALAAVANLAGRRARFTASDVVEEISKLSDAKTPDLRSLGAVMLRAKHLGLITNDGLVRSNNGRSATTLWASGLHCQSPQRTTVNQSQNVY